MSTLFEIKSSQLNLLAMQLRSTDWKAVCANLLQKYGPGSDGEKFFNHDPVILDFDYLQETTEARDFKELLSALRQCHLLPVAVRSKAKAWTDVGFANGLAEATRYTQRRSEEAPSPTPKKAIPDPVADPVRSIILDKPVRGGQKIYSPGDLIALHVVNSGAELIADGNIHVYAPLRGRALAGARGDTTARIFAQQFSPELVSIAGVYKTSEKLADAKTHNQSVQVYLSADGKENLLIQLLN